MPQAPLSKALVAVNTESYVAGLIGSKGGRLLPLAVPIILCMMIHLRRMMMVV